MYSRISNMLKLITRKDYSFVRVKLESNDDPGLLISNDELSSSHDSNNNLIEKCSNVSSENNDYLNQTPRRKIFDFFNSNLLKNHESDSQLKNLSEYETDAISSRELLKNEKSEMDLSSNLISGGDADNFEISNTDTDYSDLKDKMIRQRINYLREKSIFYEKKVNGLENHLRSKCKLYENKIARKRQEINDIRVMHTDEIIRLQNKHNEDISNIKTSFNEEIDNIKRKHFSKELKLKSEVELLKLALDDSELVIMEHRNDLNKVILIF
jgi:hypothetical protein